MVKDFADPINDYFVFIFHHRVDFEKYDHYLCIIDMLKLFDDKWKYTLEMKA